MRTRTVAAALAATFAAAPAAHAATARPVASIPAPTNLAFDGQGRLWVTSGAGGSIPSGGVWLVPRTGAKPRHVVKGIDTALGVAWKGSAMYVSHVLDRSTGAITRYSRFDGSRFAARKRLFRLPIGRHQVDSIVAGPDGRLYAGVGSEFDATASTKRLSATVISFKPDGSGLEVVARGLRNPYGLAFIPGTRLLLVSDNGRDDLGEDLPPEELNLVDTSKPPADYGFPGCYGQGGSRCAGKVDPIVDLPTHAAAGGVAAFADPADPARVVAFVAQNGSTIRPSDPTGRDVLRVVLTRQPDGSYAAGAPSRFFGPLATKDPLGAAASPDGRALYLTLFRSGKVVRFLDVPR